MADKHYFYVLRCADGTYYAGYTTDVKRREREHNETEKGAKYTKIRRPVSVVYVESFETRSQATKAESAFKKLSRKEKESIIYGSSSKKLC